MSDSDKKNKTQTLEEHVLHTLGLGPRSKIKKAFLEKKILLNGKPAPRTAPVSANDHIEILATNVFEKATAAVVPNASQLLQPAGLGPDWVAICKPAGMKPHPLHPAEQNTALNFLSAAHPEATQPYDADRPLQGGLIHRLDVGTSGLLFAARSAAAWQNLRKHWVSGATEKIYLAWVLGDLKTCGIVEGDIAADPKSSKRMRLVGLGEGTGANRPNQWPSRTAIYPLFATALPASYGAPSAKATLVLVRIFTGVRHQIRVTLQALGHPVLKDPVYQNLPVRPNTLPALKPLTAEIKTPFENLSQRIAEHLNIFHDFEIMHKLVPDSAPESGFFLHALWARHPEIEGLQEGLYCSPPDYF